MPRTLPWVRKTQPWPAKKSHRAAGLSHDSFDEAIQTRSGKGKEQVSDSENDLSDLAGTSVTPRTNLLRRGAHYVDRAPSSSPPPIVSGEDVLIEPMRKGVSRFDLRDDEWMMVEDEFLETAKLFTRHLHIAEYKRLKEMIEAKKNDARIIRPVVPNPDFSMDGATREGAQGQANQQGSGIRRVFTRSNHEDESSTTQVTLSRKNLSIIRTSDSETDDLDTLYPTRRLPHPKQPTPAPPPPPPPKHTTPRPQPDPPKPRTRPARPLPFDMLDAYAPPNTPKPAPPVSAKTDPLPATLNGDKIPDSTSPIKTTSKATMATTPTPTRTFTPTPTPIKSNNKNSNTPTHHPPKRKAEPLHRSSQHPTKRNVVQLDDIPTFLV